MHETPLVRDLVHKIESVARGHGGCKVLRATVILGPMSPFAPAALCEQFEHAAEGTLAQGAKLVIEQASDLCDPLAAGVLLESVDLQPVVPPVSTRLSEVEELVAPRVRAVPQDGRPTTED